ncbi:hypothetical protein IQ07DRAFT_524291 [Pyrenochaeta sp. DS3sAY3a]|nr:hypothetical protein IQ07DRAFT_524291 [Pyrenochaeta sp. DS3sAY3a]
MDNQQNANAAPRIYTIDLSLPPSDRYTKVIEDFRHIVPELMLLFDEVLTAIKPRFFPLWLCHLIFWVFLRQIHSKEQNAELQGFSTRLKLPVYVLVAYNVLLDLLMGCTSGGVLIKGVGHAEPRMHHFRTLDWGMPSLRKAIVQYNYVEEPGGEIVASTISYVGFVGVITGVKKGLSISLNFRPYHNAHGWTVANLQYYSHIAMVLLGRRPSIAAQLRTLLLPPRINSLSGVEVTNRGILTQINKDLATDIFQIKSALDQKPTTAAYIIMCNGDETVVIEKDLQSSKMTQSSTFITTTNHDLSYESETCAHSETKQFFLGIGMDDLIAESVERKRCLVKKWEAHLRRQRRKDAQGSKGTEDTAQGIRLQDLKRWMLTYPICNEETHFVCIMDPVEGVMRWAKCFKDGEISGEEDES